MQAEINMLLHIPLYMQQIRGLLYYLSGMRQSFFEIMLQKSRKSLRKVALSCKIEAEIV